MPPAPRSPRPRMRSPSVTTMKRTSFSGQLESRASSRPRAVTGKIHAARLAKDVREPLTRVADRWRIDERHVRGRVRHQDRVIECLVALLQIRQHEILLQIVRK